MSNASKEALMTQQLEGWELAKLDKWCQMCGAAPGEFCTIISGDPEAGEKPGDVRYHPHFYRSSDTKPGVLVPDEPAFAEPAQPEFPPCDCRANDWEEGDNNTIRCAQCGGYAGQPGTSIQLTAVQPEEEP